MPALASSWNLLGGYAGYPSLGHVAFFGIGAYAIGILFSNSVGDGYLPFLVLPLIGIGVALFSLPIGWISMRTRADVFAIVTITLLFIAQTLAFNLNSVTGGAQGKSVAPPPFPVDDLRLAVLLRAWSPCSPWRWESRSISAVRRSGSRSPTVRADEDKAHGVGVRVTAVKLIAFAVSVRTRRDGRRSLGVLRRLHLPAVRGGPADHDRHGADGVPRRPRRPCGARYSARSSWCPHRSCSRSPSVRASSTCSPTPPSSS